MTPLQAPARRRRRRGAIAAAGVGLLLLIQLVPVERTNPPVTREAPAPETVRAIVRRACYDCHSNETVWPWYARIAPVSWLVANDVREGRDELNFSTWDRYADLERARKLKEAGKQVAEGEMPPWYYTAVHARARLSPDEAAALRAWASDDGRSASD